MSKFKLFDSVVATRDILEPELTGASGRGKPGYVDGKPAVLKGTHGAIIDILENFGDVGVEFFDESGETIDIAFVPESSVRRRVVPSGGIETRSRSPGAKS